MLIQCYQSSCHKCRQTSWIDQACTKFPGNCSEGVYNSSETHLKHEHKHLQLAASTLTQEGPAAPSMLITTDFIKEPHGLSKIMGWHSFLSEVDEITSSCIADWLGGCLSCKLSWIILISEKYRNAAQKQGRDEKQPRTVHYYETWQKRETGKTVTWHNFATDVV